MADVQATTLYEQDFYLWALDQARALRDLRDALSGRHDLATVLDRIDWDDLIEEVESFAKRDQRELQSRVMTIVEHLLKLEASTAGEPRRGWETTVRRERRDVDLLLRQSPSLRRQVGDCLSSGSMAKTIKETLAEIVRRGEVASVGAAQMASNPYTEAQILEDWWPDRKEPTP